MDAPRGRPRPTGRRWERRRRRIWCHSPGPEPCGRRRRQYLRRLSPSGTKHLSQHLVVAAFDEQQHTRVAEQFAAVKPDVARELLARSESPVRRGKSVRRGESVAGATAATRDNRDHRAELPNGGHFPEDAENTRHAGYRSRPDPDTSLPLTRPRGGRSSRDCSHELRAGHVTLSVAEQPQSVPGPPTTAAALGQPHQRCRPRHCDRSQHEGVVEARRWPRSESPDVGSGSKAGAIGLTAAAAHGAPSRLRHSARRRPSSAHTTGLVADRVRLGKRRTLHAAGPALLSARMACSVGRGLGGPTVAR
jgi:hypothetical protein